MKKEGIKETIKEAIKEVINEDYIITEKTVDMKELEEHWKQMEKDKKKNRKIAKERGIKIWTWNEIQKEYSRIKQDCNYMPLELVGKPSYFVSPTYDGRLTGEYIKVSDLKTTKVEEGIKK